MEVYIVGLGACTAIGENVDSTMAAFQASIAGFEEHPYWVDKAKDRVVIAQASYVEEFKQGSERFLSLSLPAIRESLTPLQAIHCAFPIPCMVGLPKERPGLAPNLSQEIIRVFRENTKLKNVQTISLGHVSGLCALQKGFQDIQNSSTDFFLAGGVDSYLEPSTLEWLDEQDQLHSPSNKWGFIPGEAAAFCLLASRHAVERYQLKILGKILSISSAQEKCIPKKDVCIGMGLSQAVKSALEVLGNPNNSVDCIICDMNGEVYRAEEYGFTVIRTAEYFKDPSFHIAPADTWGDVGACSGILFVILALKTQANGSQVLVWTSSESGERCSCLLYVNGSF